MLGRRDREEPPAARRWWRHGARTALSLALVALLGFGLAGCSLAASGPPRATLLQALALQIQLTQADVARALGLASVAAPLVSRVRVERQEPVAIGQNAGLRLSGRFDWRLGKDPFRVDAPFEIFLERGSRGESWRLARPAGPAPEGGQEWLTYPLPLRQGDSLTATDILPPGGALPPAA
ncbi:MAG: hypothetical protein VKO39_04520 [Cyanobacteriota bacterium]|nr:hypothetical protein [Cyanobacteriota bacterium]